MLGLLTAAAIAACSPPEGTSALLERPERMTVLPNDLAVIEAFVADHSERVAA